MHHNSAIITAQLVSIRTVRAKSSERVAVTLQDIIAKLLVDVVDEILL